MSIPFIMDEERLFIANLSKGTLGHEKANLLGSLLTTQFQLAAMARSNRPEAECCDFCLFIDEFQNFSTDAFTSILAETRKSRSCLLLSHQYIDQLVLPMRQAAFGSLGTFISFRGEHADAEVLEKEFGNEFTASAITDLNRYEASVKLPKDRTNRVPFRAKMFPPRRIALAAGTSSSPAHMSGSPCGGPRLKTKSISGPSTKSESRRRLRKR